MLYSFLQCSAISLKKQQTASLRFFRNRPVFFLMLLVLLCSDTVLNAQGKKTNEKFPQSIQKWISVSSLDQRAVFFSTCESIVSPHAIAINFDRQIIPNQKVAVSLPLQGTLLEVVTQLARSQNVEVRTLGDSLLVLNSNSAQKLKTLITIRTKEIAEKNETNSSPVTFSIREKQKILQPRDRVWNKLDRPRELVINSAKDLNIEVINPEKIPHDLWREGKIPKATLIEFVSFVLVQYDLTFAWEPGNKIRILDAPSHVAYEEIHRIPPKKYNEFRDQLIQKFPESRWQEKSGSTLVTGSFELHQQLKELLRSKSKPSLAQKKQWAKRRFSMRVVRKPVGEVFKALSASGLPIHIDREKIQAIEIDLKQPITFETQNATLEQLLQAICEPVKIPYQITDKKIDIGATNLSSN